MNGVLIDTNAYVAFTQGVLDAVDIVSRASRIVVPSVVLGELQAGFAAGNQAAANLKRLEKFLSLPAVETAVIDVATAVFYGKLYADLRARGRPLPTNDIWVAAIVLQHDLRLFTYDRHFQQISGLQIGATLADLTK